jgi:predicted NBD/HSP70 family sugar kinase
VAAQLESLSGALAPLAARQQSLRDHNLSVVLRQVADAAGAVSRADVAGTTGLTRSTVSSLVETLVEAGLVQEVGPGPRTGAGRPANGLVVSGARVAGLGLELNVDYMAACVLDLSGQVRHREVLPADQRGTAPARAVSALAALARRALAAADRDGLTVCGAAVALPGLVHAPDGLLRLAPNLGWRDVDVIDLLRRDPALRRRPALAVSVDNEANLAALGELSMGGTAGGTGATAGGHPQSFLYVSGEIGVGAGLVLDGRIFRGTHGWGGEIGHLPVDPDGPMCSCGSRGCLEQVAGQEAILRRSGLRTVPGTSLAGRPVAALVSTARRGDRRLLSALDEAGRALGLAVSAVVNVVDVDTVVLGGLYAELAEWIVPPVADEIARRVLAHAWSPVTVRVSTLGGDAAVLGAAASVVRSTVEHPAETLRLLAAESGRA